ncbi:MAG: SLOG family protein [Clostridia bacterium]
MELTCAFTGHRPQSLPWGYNENDNKCLSFKRRLTTTIHSLIQSGCIHFISGMAIGFDMMSAEVVLQEKQINPLITLECAIPCSNQSSKWKTESITRYNNILHKADLVTILQHEYTNDCMHKRNDYMVNKCDILLACFNGTPSGTAYTIKQAENKNKKIIILSPI